MSHVGRLHRQFDNMLIVSIRWRVRIFRLVSQSDNHYGSLTACYIALSSSTLDLVCKL